MNHYTWTYVGGGGQNYRVGLLHSPRTGHLVIYVGSKIVQVDFKVLDSKEYTFFIEDELVHIRLERRGTEMYFYFNIDKTTDTPRNRARWALERNHLRHLALAFACMCVLVTGFVLWGRHAKTSSSQRRDALFAKGSEKTTGRISIKRLDGQKSEVTYQFVVGTQAITSPPEVYNEPLILLVNPLPLEPGDEFQVRYATAQPVASEILYDEPTPRQVETYLHRVADQHDSLHPTAPLGMTVCFVKTAYQHGKLDALADIYFQRASRSENDEHNLETYTKLTTDRSFLAKMETNCGHLKPLPDSAETSNF